MAHKLLTGAVALAITASVSFAQGASDEALAKLDCTDARSLAQTKLLRERAAMLTGVEAAQLQRQLEKNPRDLETRMVLLFHEEPELRRQRREQHDPKPHGRLVLGLIEHYPRSQLAGSAGLLLYPYKRDGMYTGPAWDAAIELWEALVAANPKDAAIACNAGSFLMADPFRMTKDGPRALALLRRARELAPKESRWALKLGAYYSMNQAMTREPEARAAAAKACRLHLRAAWDLADAATRPTLRVMGQPLSMVLATAYFDAGETKPARTFAIRALYVEVGKEPGGKLVFEMNDLLGRIAHGEGDMDNARRYLLAAGKTVGSPTLGSFGPDMTLAKALLAAGQRDVVLEFLESCKTFWHSGKDQLESWIGSISAGKNPWIGSR